MAGAGACSTPLGLFQSSGGPNAEPALSGSLHTSSMQQAPGRPIGPGDSRLQDSPLLLECQRQTRRVLFV